MDICKQIKEYLESKYFVGFVVKKIEDKIDEYNIKLVGAYDAYFEINVCIKNEIRLIITAIPEKYGMNFLIELNNSSKEKRKNFCNIWDIIGMNKITININGVEYNSNEFLNDNTKWKSFSLRYSASPFYDLEKNDMLDSLLEKVNLICSMMLSLVNYTVMGSEEGKEHQELVTKYERNIVNRNLCLSLKGYKCAVCGFNFSDVYGEVGEKFIEVHHALMVSQMEEGHVIDVQKELFPVCSNCHSMLHRRFPPYSIEELSAMLEEKKNESKHN